MSQPNRTNIHEALIQIIKPCPIMEDFDFQYDFSQLNTIELQKDKISHVEIVSVFENNYSCTYPIEGFELHKCYYFMIGFSSKSRFLYLALNVEENKIIFHQVKVANEQEIRQDYCGQ